ncbi:8343_t:CDS:2, partial [Entrophospora sp. SA101]
MYHLFGVVKKNLAMQVPSERLFSYAPADVISHNEFKISKARYNNNE